MTRLHRERTAPPMNKQPTSRRTAATNAPAKRMPSLSRLAFGNRNTTTPMNAAKLTIDNAVDGVRTPMNNQAATARPAAKRVHNRANESCSRRALGSNHVTIQRKPPKLEIERVSMSVNVPLYAQLDTALSAEQCLQNSVTKTRTSYVESSC